MHSKVPTSMFCCEAWLIVLSLHSHGIYHSFPHVLLWMNKAFSFVCAKAWNVHAKLQSLLWDFISYNLLALLGYITLKVMICMEVNVKKTLLHLSLAHLHWPVSTCQTTTNLCHVYCRSIELVGLHSRFIFRLGNS